MTCKYQRLSVPIKKEMICRELHNQDTQLRVSGQENKTHGTQVCYLLVP